jgi:signal peptidase II
MKLKLWAYGIIAAVVMGIDQLTKYYAIHHVANRWNIAPFFSIDVVLNRGMSWSLFHASGSSSFFLVSAATAVITLGVAWYGWIQYRQGESIIGETLVVAGSISNILDRAMHGGVVDFILLSYGDWAWPTFNIADMCIVFGLVCLMLKEVMQWDRAS